MAATATGRRLTEAHRVSQARLAALTTRDLVSLWPLLDPTKDATFPAYARAVSLLVKARRSESAALSAAYWQAFRRVEGASGPLAAKLAAAVPQEALTTSLLVTGPVKARQDLARGVPFEKAVVNAQAATVGAVSRHVLNAGRQTIMGSSLRDPETTAFARVTSGRCCAFCAMLAGRGAVYRNEATADFSAHDTCLCSVEPSYRTKGALPPGSQKYADLYREHIAGKTSSANAVGEFRKVLAKADL